MNIYIILGVNQGCDVLSQNSQLSKLAAVAARLPARPPSRPPARPSVPPSVRSSAHLSSRPPASPSACLSACQSILTESIHGMYSSLINLAPFSVWQLFFNYVQQIQNRHQHMYIYIHICIRLSMYTYTYIYTRNYPLAIVSASFPTGSHGNPLGITLGSLISKPKVMILDPKMQVLNVF